MRKESSHRKPTAHAVEFLAEVDPHHPALRRALDYLEKTQETDGSWYGRWGVNYLYGTGLVLAGLQAAGEIFGQPYPRHAAAWLLSRQNPDGGWGETCYSYEAVGQRAVGPSTASQTAWALLGLMAAGETFSQSVQAGIDYLLRTQQEDGTWEEEAYTGTGFPRAFYLKYELYSIYFPLIAFARYRTYLMKTMQ